MTTLMQRIGTKVQVALASVLVAGTVLAATPLTAGAHSSPCGDMNGDGRVSIVDLLMVRSEFHQWKLGGGTYGAVDILIVIRNFGTTC